MNADARKHGCAIFILLHGPQAHVNRHECMFSSCCTPYAARTKSQFLLCADDFVGQTIVFCRLPPGTPGRKSAAHAGLGARGPDPPRAVFHGVGRAVEALTGQTTKSDGLPHVSARCDCAFSLRRRSASRFAAALCLPVRGGRCASRCAAALCLHAGFWRAAFTLEVIAPSEAEETSAQYLAKTPVV
jgi:hypothetical protein